MVLVLQRLMSTSPHYPDRIMCGMTTPVAPSDDGLKALRHMQLAGLSAILAVFILHETKNS
jgi:hypothetical protein